MIRFKTTVALVGLTVVAAACTEPRETSLPLQAEQTGERPTIARGPDEGLELWVDGTLLNIKIDRISVPYASMMVVTETLAANGIPVHLHTFEDELIYVVRGRGAAIVGDDRKEIPIEAGSVLYVPTGEWHGVRNADPDQPMEILLVTTPVSEGGVGDFFRKTGTRPGHPPLDLSEEEFLALFSQYGMEVP